MTGVQTCALPIFPIINSELSYNTFSQLKKKGIPFVICNRSIDGLDAPFIGTNNNYGAYIATKHLIEQGCRKLSYISEKKYSTAIERYHGFETAIYDSPTPVQKHQVIFGNYDDYELKSRIRDLFGNREHPDGVLCFDDTTAAVLYTMLEEKGLRPGRDVRIVGYNDSSLCNMLSVPLSSVSSEGNQMGREAITMLMGIIRGTGAAEDFNDFKVINPRLMARKSSTGRN